MPRLKDHVQCVVEFSELTRKDMLSHGSVHPDDRQDLKRKPSFRINLYGHHAGFRPKFKYCSKYNSSKFYKSSILLLQAGDNNDELVCTITLRKLYKKLKIHRESKL